jgi:ABC-type amino acid transport substrate-binding protein
MRHLAFLIVAATLATAARADETIIIGYFENPPWVISRQGQSPTGISVDYWEKEIAPAMHLTVKWVGPSSMLRLFKQLETGEIDAAAVAGKNPERAKIFLYPNAPYATMRPALAFLKTSPLTAIKQPSDIAGLKVGYFQGGIISPFLKSASVTYDMVSSSTWQQECFAKLLHGRVDAVHQLNVEALLYQAAQTGQADKIKILQLPEATQDMFSPFAPTPRGRELLKRYNEVNGKHAKAVDGLIKKYVSAS